MKSTSLESSGQYGNMRNVAHFANYQKFISACCSSGHREALSDIFDVIDVDGNGLLSLEEYNFFELRTSGEKCDKDAWLVCKGHHFSMTYTGCVYLCRCVWKNDRERSTKTHLFCCFCWESRKLWYEEESADTPGLHGAEPDGGHREGRRPCWPVDQPGSYGLQPNTGTSTCLCHPLVFTNSHT